MRPRLDIEYDEHNNPKPRGVNKESYNNPLVEYGKGRPTDPQYYSKISVKSIKDAVLKSKLEQPLEVVVPDTRHRMFKHRCRFP